MGSNLSKIRTTSVIGLGLLMLTSCSQSGKPASNSSNSDNQTYLFENQELKYQVEIPQDFADKKGDENKMYFGYAVNSKTGGAMIELGKGNFVCSEDYTGTSQGITIENTDGITSWGRIDFWDDSDREGWEPRGDFEKLVCKNNSRLPKATYVLCSQKEDKTVFICLNEDVNNPTLAKQIFETFKWTK